jgi:hypothetical protein
MVSLMELSEANKILARPMLKRTPNFETLRFKPCMSLTILVVNIW